MCLASVPFVLSVPICTHLCHLDRPITHGYKCVIVGSWKVYTAKDGRMDRNYPYPGNGNYKAALPKCRWLGADLVGKDSVDEVRYYCH